jgi:hypothetical protein
MEHLGAIKSSEVLHTSQHGGTLNTLCQVKESSHKDYTTLFTGNVQNEQTYGNSKLVVVSCSKEKDWD